MGPGSDREPTRGPRGVAALVASAAVLSGCSLASSVGSSDNSPSWTSRVASLFSGSTPGVTQPHSPTPTAPDVECPGVDIRAGASTLNIAAKAVEATAGDLRYQLSFGQTARECAVQGATMSIKVGVQGRVILGRACRISGLKEDSADRDHLFGRALVVGAFVQDIAQLPTKRHRILVDGDPLLEALDCFVDETEPLK